MAKTNVKEKFSNSHNVSSTTTTTTYVDKCGLFIVVTTVILILIVVITGILVKFLVSEPLSSIILITLICFLFVLGVISLTILEIRRRRHNKIVQTVTVRNGRTYHNIQPSAPQEETSWQYSNRATMPAS